MALFRAKKPRPRCPHCERVLRRISNNAARRERGALVAGLGGIIAVAAQSWTAWAIFIALGLIIGWPRRPRWVCDICGIVYDDI